MHARSMVSLGAFSLLLLAAAPDPSRAQPPAPTPAPSHAERPADPPATNLQVLPKEWTRRQVIDNVMKNWTADLGVRCQHCHVGEEGKPFTEWDFPSDAKPEKQTAREMLRMLQEINRRLEGIETLHGHGKPQATCYTCHRGQPHPRRIEAVFEETRAHSGLAAAIAEYRELRTKHQAAGGYDFSARPLLKLGRERLVADDVAGAREIFGLAVELGFDTLATRLALAEAALAGNDRAAAVAHLEKALALAANAAEREHVEEQLRKARGEGEASPP